MPVPSGDTYIYFNADELDYDGNTRTAGLLGDVNVTAVNSDFDETRIYSENLYINQAEQKVYNEGEVRVEQDGGELRGENLFYDYQNSHLTLQNISAEYPPIRLLHADSAEFKNGRQRYRGAQVTCCDQEDPHYHLKAGSVTMTPEKRVYVTNALLYLSDVPVFYLPFFWRSLDSKKPFTTYVDFTQSARTGYGLLTSTVFFPTRNLRTTVNLDGYTKAGFGYGVQLLVQNTDKVIGNLEAYAIDDQKEEDYRWGVSGGFWAQLFDNSDHLNRDDGGAMYTMQSQFRSVSDPYFNDTYFRSNPFKFMPDQDINVAFSRQSRRSITRISYSQKDEYNYVTEEYEIVEKILPKFEYHLMPFTLPLGIVNRFNANVYNTEVRDEGFKQTAGAFWHSSRSFNLNRTFTLLPYVSLDERVIFRDKDNNEDAYVTRLGSGVNLRAELLTGSLDISYDYLKRFSTGTLNTDNVSDDMGEELNRIYIQNHYRPSQWLYFRLGTGYDLRETQDNWSFDNRMLPILAELGVNTMNGDLNLFAQNLYDVKEGQEAFVLQSDFRMFKKSRMVFGMNNYSLDQNSYLFNTKFWFRPENITWYFDVGVDFEIRQGSLNAYSRSFKVYKDFHDAHMEFGVEDRNNNLSFAFRIAVLCGKKHRDDTFSKEDRYWSPWRNPGDLR
ncbi:transcription-repair coupling factor [Elusimicrobium minutum Pei191]|uniref:Transcription-repair coupling factor n=2 Tax=Elusimicrobium TaxID=423604 RepID=B2KBN9_ELUMP|nr:transcription-repair coupling factor [Elusimicrobium minutum Pei191]